MFTFNHFNFNVKNLDTSLKFYKEALGLEPEQVLVVGDSYKKDIVPAESLGCKVLWLKGKGWTADEDAVMHPNIIKNISEVLNVAL